MRASRSTAIYGDLRRRRTFYEGLSQARSWSRGVAEEFELARARARRVSSLIEFLRKGTRAGGLVNRLIFAVA